MSTNDAPRQRRRGAKRPGPGGGAGAEQSGAGAASAAGARGASSSAGDGEVPPEQEPSRLAAWCQRGLDLFERLQDTRLARALARYSGARGALLAGGIAYTALFSVFAALAIGVTTLMLALGRHPGLRQAVLDSLGQALPGVIDGGDGSGLVSIDQLVIDSPLSLGSAVAVVVMVVSAMGLMGALANAVRAMFGIVQLPRNPVVAQLVNLLGFLVLMASVVLTAVASLATGALTEQVKELGALPAWLSGWGAKALSLAVALVLDAAVLVLLVRLSGVRAPRRDLLPGALLGAVAYGLLRELGTGVVAEAVKNPLLASFAALVVLVLWIHLAARVTLVLAAWIANPPRPQAVGHPDEVHMSERPNYVTMSAPATLDWPHQTISGALDVDPTLNPGYEPPQVEAEPAPRRRRGPLAWLARRRFARATARYEKARKRYYQAGSEVSLGR